MPPTRPRRCAFIDYMLRPEVAAANTNFVAYASGNLAAKKFVKPEILSNPGIYPDEATMQRLSINTAWDDRTQRFVTRLWTRVRTAMGAEVRAPGQEKARRDAPGLAVGGAI